MSPCGRTHSFLRTHSEIDGAVINLPSGETRTSVTLDSTVKMLSTIGSIDALYSRWYGDRRLELSAQYTLIYTDAFRADNPVLSTIAWNHAPKLKSRYSGPTTLMT